MKVDMKEIRRDSDSNHYRAAAVSTESSKEAFVVDRGFGGSLLPVNSYMRQSMGNSCALVLLLVPNFIRGRCTRRGGGYRLGLRDLTDSPTVCSRPIARVRPSRDPASVRLGFRGRAHIVRMGAVSADMLFHVVLAGEGFVADGTVDALLAGMLLAVPGCVARCRERGRTPVARRVGAGILVLATRSPRSSRLRRGCFQRRGRGRLPLGRRSGGSGPAGRKTVRLPPRVLPGVRMIGR